MQRLDLQDELCRTRQRFLKKHSGMEQYLRREKALLLVLMLFVCAHKLSVLFAAGSELTVSGLIGAMLGIGLPAFFALAVYSGRWQYGLFSSCWEDTSPSICLTSASQPFRGC